MRGDDVKLHLSGSEQRLMVNGLVTFRNGLISDARPTEDVEDLILKVIDARPLRKHRKRRDRDSR